MHASASRMDGYKYTYCIKAISKSLCNRKCAYTLTHYALYTCIRTTHMHNIPAVGTQRSGKYKQSEGRWLTLSVLPYCCGSISGHNWLSIIPLYTCTALYIMYAKYVRQSVYLFTACTQVLAETQIQNSIIGFCVTGTNWRGA